MIMMVCYAAITLANAQETVAFQDCRPETGSQYVIRSEDEKTDEAKRIEQMKLEGKG